MSRKGKRQKRGKLVLVPTVHTDVWNCESWTTIRRNHRLEVLPTSRKTTVLEWVECCRAANSDIENAAFLLGPWVFHAILTPCILYVLSAYVHAHAGKLSIGDFLIGGIWGPRI